MPRYIFILLLFVPTFLFGQAQDCGNVEPLCQCSNPPVTPSPGTGFIDDLANYTGCLDNGENNSQWFIFTIQNDGLLEFDIVPSAPADYDFALFRLSQPNGSSFDCSDIRSGALPEVRCNYSGVSQDTTGLRNPYVNTTSTPSGPPYSAPLNVFEGEVYVLLVDKFSSGVVAYGINFCESTASVADAASPEIKEVTTPGNCQPVDTVEITLSEPVLCDQLLDFSNFIINGPQSVTVVDVISDCDTARGERNDQVITLVLSPPIVQGGSYTFTAQNLVDYCGNVIDPISGAFSLNLFEIPIANDSLEIATSCIADTFFFFNVSEGTVSDVLWDFGDGTTSTLDNPVHIFDSLGNYTVALIVTSPDNCIDTSFRTITVVNSFQAEFTISSSNICSGEEIQFTDQTRGGANTWDWDFGDGNGSTLENPTHTYQEAGTYNVRLLASDAFTPGCAPDSFSLEVEVYPNANASFSVEDTACQSQFVQFDSITESPTVVAYSWDFGDNSNSSSPSPEFFYSQPGEYTIQLIVEDEFCGVDTSSEFVFVKPSPQFSLGNDTSICVSDEYILRVNDTEVDRIRWSNGSTEDVLIVTDFPSQISVEVLKNGCTTTDQVFIGAKPDGCYIVNIPSGFSPNDDGLNDILKVLPTRILDFELKIFNRWGELLYENPGMFNQGWDGTYDGEPQDVGVYTYFIKATGMDGRTIRQSGNITLLR